MIRILSILFISLFCSAIVFAEQPKLVPHPIKLKNGKQFALNLPSNFDIIPAAEGLKRVRFFAKAPDGRIFVTDMHDLSDNQKGTIYILDDLNAETGKFGKIIPYMTGLKNPNSVQFYTDTTGQDWLYLAETHQLTRRKFTQGEIKPTVKAEVLATFPDYGLSYKYGGWHLTRTIAVGGNGKIYVSVGSSCNACTEKEKVRASVLEMNSDGSEQRIYAQGLRNAVGLKWVGKFLFATNQGADHLGKSKPDETFYALKRDADYGWPSCYSSNGKNFADPKFKRVSGCKNVPSPYAYFPSHSSALGFDYFDHPNTDDAIKNSFLVALHGSTDEKVGHGYKIAIMRKGQKLETFMDGFLVGKKVNGRPADIYRIDENSFYFSDDRAGIVYYVRRRE
ncbi:PQQ-dependent sugar dehydrogenase [Acinetobacter sp. WCHAc060025]|uniref:PQQ-dependent sugar dehydrogenase n=1 Tax=Acinetobacter sp. WCHAc060025 TaxID=2518625 RepID=UPI001023AB7B|nr:PQQ-dependent sugar dehydrogenase [Acinetobacter sp. WCHAc060025]RZG71791.1 glucose/sorbosone dehydrogenase [Acinetobacter sp. WCHAc060025]